MSQEVSIIRAPNLAGRRHEFVLQQDRVGHCKEFPSVFCARLRPQTDRSFRTRSSARTLRDGVCRGVPRPQRRAVSCRGRTVRPARSSGAARRFQCRPRPMGHHGLADRRRRPALVARRPGASIAFRQLCEGLRAPHPNSASLAFNAGKARLFASRVASLAGASRLISPSLAST